MFEVRDRKFSVVNYIVNFRPAHPVHESLTGMNEWRLLSQPSPKFQTSQRPRTVFANIDIRISQFEQLSILHKRPAIVSLVSPPTSGPTYVVIDGVSSSRTTSSYNCHDCFRELGPGEGAGLWKRMLVEADDTVEVEKVLSRREELLAHSGNS